MPRRFSKSLVYDNTGNLNLSWPESFYAAAAFSLYPEQPPQWILAAVCVVGVVALVRRRRAWLALPGTYMLLVYAACRCKWTRATRCALSLLASGTATTCTVPLLRRDIPRARGRHGPCRHRRLRSEES